MNAKIISMLEARKYLRPTRRETDKDFQTLFSEAQELRHLAPKIVPGEIAVVGWNGTRDWFQRGIAEEVFRQKLFGRSVLISICYVSELLTAYAKDEVGEVGIADNISSYSGSGKPDDILKAANSAFLFFVFWPEKRTCRSVSYRKIAIDYGPGLYSTYASETRKDFGYHMAEAFEPLGNIVRDRFTLIQ